MARRKKGAVRIGLGSMCNICGLNCGKGGALKKHIEAKHIGVSNDAYKTCFYRSAKTVLADAWDDSVSTKNGKTVVVHILARRFFQSSAAKPVTRSVKQAV
jgi:hypothetical protein